VALDLQDPVFNRYSVSVHVYANVGEAKSDCAAPYFHAMTEEVAERKVHNRPRGKINMREDAFKNHRLCLLAEGRFKLPARTG
jgi:hypothetical protein